MSYIHYPKRYEILETFGDPRPEEHGYGGAIVYDTESRDTQLHYYEPTASGDNVLCLKAYSVDKFEQEFGKMVTDDFRKQFEEETGYQVEDYYEDQSIYVLFEKLASYYGSWSVFAPDDGPDYYPTPEGLQLFIRSSIKDLKYLVDNIDVPDEKWEAIINNSGLSEGERIMVNSIFDLFK